MVRKRKNLSGQLRAAVDASDKTRYRLALDAEIDHSSMSRFMHGKAGLSMEAIDRLADALGLELQPKRPARKRRAKKGR